MFIFKGKNSNDMGVYVREENFLGKAPMRYDSIEIEGKHGGDLVELGYQNFEGTLNDVVIMNDNFDEVLHWLSGTGELIYMGKKTRVHFLDAYQIAKHKKTFSVPFIREPFWYNLEDEYSEAWGVNLIPNGWDSFEPYGNEGKETRAPLEVFNKNYSPNYFLNGDFRNGTQNWGHTSIEIEKVFDGLLCEVKEKNHYSRIVQIREVTKGDKYYASIEVTPKYDSSVHLNIGGLHSVSDTLTPNIRQKLSNVIEADKDNTVIWVTHDTRPYNIGENFTIHSVLLINLTERYGEGDEPTKEWCDNNLKYYAHWEDIPEKDKPVRAWSNMAIHMTPLENGLTRVQTWGGNNRLKLRATLNQELVETNSSVYIKNRGNGFKLSRWVGHASRVDVNTGHDGLISFNQTSTIKNSTWGLDALEINDNLDFIASTPTIVEGDTPPTWEADENPRIVNEGTAPSKPLIKLTKGTSSTCEFEVNGVYFKYHFNNDDHVIIDCEEMEARYNGLPRNRHLTIGFEFPTLKVGDNVVKNISGDAKIEFKRKDRWL